MTSGRKSAWSCPTGCRPKRLWRRCATWKPTARSRRSAPRTSSREESSPSWSSTPSKWVPAAKLITPSGGDPLPLGPESAALAEVLVRHIEVTDINDEVTFFAQLTSLIDGAAASVWLWSPWVANRLFRLKLLPRLKAAIDRGVKIVLFTRDPGDPVQQKDISVKAVKALRDIGVHLVEVYHGHQKVIVVDEHTVMLLAQLHAQEFSTPPRCAACGGDRVDLRRSGSAANGHHYYWRCYSETCPAKGKGGSRAWTQMVNLKQSGNNS